MEPLVLLVEDERTIQRFMETILEVNHYRLKTASTAKEGLSLFTSYAPDLILLDLGLPDRDGLSLLADLRQFSTVPVIVVSARSNEQEKVEALDQGADDYITKPFSTAELLARIRTALRHQQQLGQVQQPQRQFEVKELRFDADRRIVEVRGQQINLTPTEYRIVAYLVQYAGKVITYDTLMRAIWGTYMNENRVLRVNMANIRKKIERNPADPEYILTELGVGYRLIDEQKHE